MILGLDLGGTLGWVKGNAVGPIQHGQFDCENTTNLGRWLKSSDTFFRTILPGVTAIAVEQPYLGDSYYPARKLLAQLGHLYYWCDAVGVPIGNVREIAISTGKHTLAGHGRADKDQMIAAAFDMHGLEGLDEHEADALGIWHVHVFGEREKTAPRRTRSGPGKSVKGGA